MPPARRRSKASSGRALQVIQFAHHFIPPPPTYVSPAKWSRREADRVDTILVDDDETPSARADDGRGRARPTRDTGTTVRAADFGRMARFAEERLEDTSSAADYHYEQVLQLAEDASAPHMPGAGRAPHLLFRRMPRPFSHTLEFRHCIGPQFSRAPHG